MEENKEILEQETETVDVAETVEEATETVEENVEVQEETRETKKSQRKSRRRKIETVEPVESEWKEQVVQIRRVTKVVKGGKKLSFRAIVIVGNKKGSVGYKNSISTLQKGVRYQFKAKYYAKVKGKKVYSKWSKTVSIQR